MWVYKLYELWNIRKSEIGPKRSLGKVLPF